MLRRTFLSMLAYAAVIAIAVSGVGIAATPDYTYKADTITVPLAIPEAQNVTPVYSDKELRCVQRTVFGEARNQSYAAQVAVAATLVSRSLSGSYPANLCEVAKQDSQYFGYSGGVALHNDIDAAAWDEAGAAAEHAVINYALLPEQYRAALYFRSGGGGISVAARKFKVLGRLDDLVFYGKSA